MDDKSKANIKLLKKLVTGIYSTMNLIWFYISKNEFINASQMV